MKYSALLSQVVKSSVIVSLVLTSAGCLRRQSTLSRADNAPVGYVSEATCLQLISGQEFRSQDVKKVVEIQKVAANCAEDCECSCNPVMSSISAAKKADVAAKQKVVVAKPRPVVAAKTVKPKVIVVRNDTLKAESVEEAEIAKETSARASLNVKKVGNGSVASGNVSGVKATGKITAAKPVVKAGPGDPKIREVQEALNQKGAKLDVDGAMGDRTVRLLRAFQTMNDLPVTGKADEATAKALGLNTSR